MTIGLVVRPAAPTELEMVLSNWKQEIWKTRHIRGWCRGLQERDYWCLMNHVLDRITVPSCELFVGCHQNDLETPICWIAIRKIPALTTWTVVYLYARQSLRKEPELAASLERELLSSLDVPIAVERRQFNAFLELRR
jgi:hypothetical protein